VATVITNFLVSRITDKANAQNGRWSARITQGAFVLRQACELPQMLIYALISRRRLPIGLPVEMVTRRIRQDGNKRGMLVYGYKFRPVYSWQG
jgi:hypothetical protein